MAKTRKDSDNNHEDREEKPLKKNNSNRFRYAKLFSSGEFLFSDNFRKSPIWFVAYIVILVLIYIGMRYEPLKRYNTMRRLNNELIRCHYRNNDVKAQLQRYQSLDNMSKIMVKQGFEEELQQPTIIKVEHNDERD